MSVLRGVPFCVSILILLYAGSAEPSSFTIRKLVTAGDPAPQGGAFAQVDSLVNVGKGAVLFHALVEKDDPFHGIYLAQGSSLSQVFATGRPSPLGGTFTDLSSVTMNSRGNVAFVGSTTGGIPQAIYLAGGNNLKKVVAVRKVVAVGDAAPTGGIFNDLVLPVLNDRGDVLFWASLDGAQAPAGLFLALNGTIEKVVARGEPIPGGGRLSFIRLSYSLNPSGIAAFHAATTGRKSSGGIFLARKETVTPVVRVGDATPLGGISCL